MPNAVERLDREGLKVIQTTAGKWKRTIDPFQAPTPEALAKAEEDNDAEAFLNHNTSYEYTVYMNIYYIYIIYEQQPESMYWMSRCLPFSPGFARRMACGCMLKVSPGCEPNLPTVLWLRQAEPSKH